MAPYSLFPPDRVEFKCSFDFAKNMDMRFGNIFQYGRIAIDGTPKNNVNYRLTANPGEAEAAHTVSVVTVTTTRKTITFNKFPREVQAMIYNLAIHDFEADNARPGAVWTVHWAYPTERGIEKGGLPENTPIPFVVVPGSEGVPIGIKIAASNPILRVDRFARHVAKDFYTIIPLSVGGNDSMHMIILRPTDIMHHAPGSLQLIKTHELNHKDVYTADALKFVAILNKYNVGPIKNNTAATTEGINVEQVTKDLTTVAAILGTRANATAGVVDFRDITHFIAHHARAFPGTIATDITTLLHLWNSGLLEALHGRGHNHHGGATTTDTAAIPLRAAVVPKRLLLTMPSHRWRAGAALSVAGYVPALGGHRAALAPLVGSGHLESIRRQAGSAASYVGEIYNPIGLRAAPLRCNLLRFPFNNPHAAAPVLFPFAHLHAATDDNSDEEEEDEFLPNFVRDEAYFEVIKAVPRLESMMREKIAEWFRTKPWQYPTPTRFGVQNPSRFGVPGWYTPNKPNDDWRIQPAQDVKLLDDAALAVIQEHVLGPLRDRAGVEVRFAYERGIQGERGEPLTFVLGGPGTKRPVYHPAHQPLGGGAMGAPWQFP